MKKSNSSYSYIDQYSDYMELVNYNDQTIIAYTATVTKFFSLVRMHSGSNKRYINYCRSYLLFLEFKTKK